MLKEFIEGYKDAGAIFKSLNQTSDIKPHSSGGDFLHFRLSWLMYIAPDFQATPERSSIFSKFHLAEQRIPGVLVNGLASFNFSLVGVFPEPLDSSGDLGYAVFTNRIAAISAAGIISTAVEEHFARDCAQIGYMYIELELSECLGSYTAPAMVVKKKILLNQGFDCVREMEEIIDVSNELAF